VAVNISCYGIFRR